MSSQGGFGDDEDDEDYPPPPPPVAASPPPQPQPHHHGLRFPSPPPIVNLTPSSPSTSVTVVVLAIDLTTITVVVFRSNCLQLVLELLVSFRTTAQFAGRLILVQRTEEEEITATPIDFMASSSTNRKMEPRRSAGRDEWSRSQNEFWRLEKAAVAALLLWVSDGCRWGVRWLPVGCAVAGGVELRECRVDRELLEFGF
ncbi:hypothetical protein E3N88_32464 [Mikania micrantha]|uniref:Uncharacterized protein n=1 Tax=Mikania micrantha TaxID=192012 RepID=A0A5N6M8J8_9ASTR|nr:hypothetical protein E3N88_32464 [Mikania micrantha]